MDKSKIVWGVICLLLAAGLTIANLALPPENIMFQIGDFNLPWVPPVVLLIIGIVLLATSGRKEEEAEAVEIEIDPEKAAVNKRLETIAWGFFLIMLGGFMFVPDEIIQGGWWSIGVGLIFLGLNGARNLRGLRMSGFTTLLGILSLIGGILDLFGWDVDGAILLIVLGAYLLLKPYLDRRQLFGKAEQV